MRWIIPGIIISYLIGSIPTAYIFGRIFRKIDIRKFGSGNVGATNAWRVLGREIGISVLILDILKGIVTVTFLGDFLLPRVSFSSELLRIILGVICIAGHNWTVFLSFKGGKGIATTLGVLLGLAVKVSGLKTILGLVILVWVGVFIVTRMVSLSSVLSGISLPVFMYFFKQPDILLFFSIVLTFLIILRHKSNLTRIFQGKESRLSLKKNRS